MNSQFYVKEIVPSGWKTIMEHAGFKASLMKAPRLKDDGRVHGLPTGDPVPVFPIAALPAAPKDWVREAGTYVCPVDVEWGLWFDFTQNDELNTAVVASVKGMNPITGLKLEGLQLEQYADKCPIHHEPFAHGRLCEKCGYEWPPQNYVCHPNTLWWDGFRQPDGKVRQFFFTDDEKRDIASLVIGKENTVPAFGFVFYKPKNPRERPKVVYRNYGYMHKFIGSNVKMGSCAKPDYFYNSNTSTISSNEIYCSSVDGIEENGVRSLYASCSSPLRATSDMATKGLALKRQSVAIGAGAQIRQDLTSDSLGLDGWQDKHSAIIRLYFCFMEQFKQIVDVGGVKDIQSNKKGFLEALPVG